MYTAAPCIYLIVDYTKQTNFLNKNILLNIGKGCFKPMIMVVGFTGTFAYKKLFLSCSWQGQSN